MSSTFYADLLSIAWGLLVVLFGAFIGVLAWIGNGWVSRMSNIERTMNEMFAKIRDEHNAESMRIWDRLDDHGTRITTIETQCSNFRTKHAEHL